MLRLGKYWLSEVESILSEEPEEWLSYRHGQLEKKLFPAVANCLGSSRVFCSLNFFATIFRRFSVKESFKSRVFKKAVDFFVFAGTQNQEAALAKTTEMLSRYGCNLSYVGTSLDSKFGQQLIDRRVIAFNAIDIVQTAILFARNWRNLSKRLEQSGEQPAFRFFDAYCMSYCYLVYFYRILKRIKPSYVLVANDHSVENRCLLAVAYRMKIKTVYLQHAAVSEFFPALRVNYAFLDGEFSLSKYRQCEENQPVSGAKFPLPKIYLSGQCKSLSQRVNGKSRKVGLAINSIDNVKLLSGLLTVLAKNGFDVCIRWHPAQPKSDIGYIKNFIKQNRGFEFSDPSQENVGGFVERVCCVVAGNSSILLEAAIAGALPIFYEVERTGIRDYYEFVKNGLAVEAESTESLMQLLANLDGTVRPRPSAIRHYSSTFGTSWEGREGELIARILFGLCRKGGCSVDLCFPELKNLGPHFLV